MLKDFEMKKPENKDQLKEQTKALRATLLGQQQQLLEAKLPVIVLIEGWAAAGKGSLIKELISEQDDTFDDMSQSLSVVVDLDDLEEQIYTTNDLYERVNILTRCLKQLYNALLGE